MSILADLTDVNQIKSLDIDQLRQLAVELRDEILTTVTKNGGHLASNLGAVELTIALAVVFDFPKDKVIFDVGHQCYAYKLLTDRRDRFSTLRLKGGISGFPKRSESIYDTYDTGHSGTAISAGAGIALARDIKGEDFNVISVVGDASLTNGVSLEAINDIGSRKTKQIIILNDNTMSISKNVGAMSYKLDKLRQYDGYKHIKNEVASFVDGISSENGKNQILRRFKNAIKYTLMGGAAFEEYGLRYFGPVNGHDISQLIEYMRMAKSSDEPVLLHIVTVKGKGCIEAEERPQDYHGVSPKINKLDTPTYSKTLGSALSDLADVDDRVVAITAAMKDGTGLAEFYERHPDRFIDVGITEEHAVVLSAGLATQSLKPYFVVYSSFLQRGFDQLLIDVSMQKLPVRFCIDRSGVVGDDGETHQGIYDLSYLSIIPDFTVLSPINTTQLYQMIAWSKDFDSPLAIRYPRGNISLDVSTSFEYGRYDYLLGDTDADTVVLSVGAYTTHEAYNAVSQLIQEGKNISLVSCPTVFPLNTEILDKLNAKNIITIEDNVRSGGFGQSVQSYISSQSIQATVRCLSIPDTFLPNATAEELYAEIGLDCEGIYKKLYKMIE